MPGEIILPHHIEPVLPGDPMRVEHGGVQDREIIYENRFGLTVVHDIQEAGAFTDWMTYSREKTTATMVLPVDERGETTLVTLVEGFRHGIGERTLEAPGQRLTQGMSPRKTAHDVAASWGLDLTGLWVMGEQDETSSRQYNITARYEGIVGNMSSDKPEFIVKGSGHTRSERVTLPLREAYSLVRRDSIPNGLTAGLILTAAIDRGLATPRRRNVKRG